MFFGRSRKETPAAGPEHLEYLVKTHLPEADTDTRKLVVSVAGLLAGIAYADRSYSEAEQARVHDALAAIEGLSAAGVEAICSLLREHIVQIATINPQAYSRTLREHGDVALRREVLDVLLDVAAADGELSVAETDLLRRTTSALGLTQDDYNAAQSRHRDKLSALR